MVGWTSLSLVPDDQHSVEDLLDWFEDHTLPDSDIHIAERNGTRFVHVYVRGYEAQRDGDDRAGALLHESAHLWDHGARIDANNTTDSGDGWPIGSDGDRVEHDDRITGSECARAHDVAEELEDVVGFRPPVRRV